MENFVKYIIEFLLGEENRDLLDEISYGEGKKSKVVIKKSNFFDEGIYMTANSMPSRPLKEIEGIPILFGSPYIETYGDKILIHADLIASTYFLISRYEECVKRELRDEHGRFIGKGSLLYKEGFLNRPIVDEYGELLRRCLKKVGCNVKVIKREFSHIYLTHDVDQIWTWDNYYKAVRSTVKRIVTNQSKKFLPMKAVHNYKKYDPVYTFPELIKWDNEIKTVYGREKCTDIYFMMGCKQKRTMDLGYCQNKKRTSDLISYLIGKKSEIGIHTSYAASLDMSLLRQEIENIEELSGTVLTKVRNHFLASREPEDFVHYIEYGLKDDFTMGYADVMGFRLGTGRCVRWINPLNKEVTELNLHPMTVMECTLNEPRYMGIKNIEDAFSIIKSQIDLIKKYNGEVVLLWHSPSVYIGNLSYQRELYVRVLSYLKELNIKEKLVCSDNL